MKTILITGATSGFGLAIARRFAADGYRLILCGRRKERLAALEQEFARSGNAQTVALSFDVRSREQTEAALTALSASESAVDVLVNNAGLAAGLEPIDVANDADIDQMIDTNLKGLLHVTRAVLPMLKRSASPCIINMGSTAAKYVYEKGNVYCATKAAVAALSEAMRIDLLPYGVRVTAIHPGLAETEFSLVRFKGDWQRARKVYEGLQPLSAEDIAGIVHYCVHLPPHVCINELTVVPTAQANPHYVLRRNS